MTEKWEGTQQKLNASEKRLRAYKSMGELYLTKWKEGAQYKSDSDSDLEEELEEQISE